MSQTPAPDQAQAEPRTTAALLDRIQAAWSELEQTVATLSEAQLTTELDAQGWSAKDHLVHITTWEQSLLALLQGRDRRQAIGLEGGEHGEIDDVNARSTGATGTGRSRMCWSPSAGFTRRWSQRSRHCPTPIYSSRTRTTSLKIRRSRQHR